MAEVPLAPSELASELAASERCVVANAPVPLDDPDAIDVVKSGAVAVFAVARDDAAGAHARRYLFTADAGAALFGLAPDAAPHGLLAVSLGVSCFLRVPWETLAPAAPGAEHGRGLIEGWARRLASSLAAIPAPAANQKLAGGKHKVKDGRTFQSDGGAVAWVTVREGRARWLGLDGFAVDASSGPVCLCEGMWLAADGPVEVEVRRTEEVADLATLRAALALHQATVLRAVAVIEARERAALAQRLRESDARSERVTGDALAELASVLEPRGAPLPEGGSPVFIAAAAVGQAIGAVIRPPGASEDLGRTKNPLDAIARASRLRTRTVILRAGFWEEDCGPLVAKVAAGAKPVALLPRGPGRYELFDPADRSRRPLDRALAETLEPVATMLYRPFPDRALRVLDLLSFSLRGYGRELALMVILTVAGTLLGMFVPLATSVLIDRAIPGGDRALLAQVALGLFAAACGAAAFQVSQGILATRAQAIADHTLQAGLWDRLLQLRMSFFRRFSAGDLKTRATAVYQIREKLGGTTLRSLLGGVASVLNLALLLYYSPKLSLIAIAIAAVNLGATTFAAVAILGRDRELVALRGSLLGLVVQLVNGVSKLRLAGAERRAFAHWAHRFARQQRLALDVKAIQDRLAVLNGATSFASAALLFYATADLVFQRPAPGALAAAAPLTTGAFLAFNSAFGAFLAGAASLSETVTSALEVVNLGERAAPILEEPPEVDLAKTDPGRLRGKIALERVTFRYRGAGAPTLDEVTIRAEPGEFIAFVGESGSGKSTILRLLLGFETPASGGIYFDDQDASKLDMNAVRRQLGVVLQTGRISAGSIHDNVSGGALVTLEEVSEAARNAGLEDDIAAMPMGLHTVISEGGTNLSGGQRQRLLIARAIVLKPRILLFDEATSALDNRTQAKVSESLDRLQATRIVIAHRLSTIRKADRIYVLERGKVVQVGSYDELAKQEGGIFERLVARQTA